MVLQLKLEKYIRDSFPLAVEHVDKEPEYPIHQHDFQELVIVTSGHGWHMCNSSKYAIGPGDVFVVGGSMRHGYSSTEELSHFNILFDLKGLRLPSHDLRTLTGFLSLFELEPRLRLSRNFKSRLHLGFRKQRKVEALAWRLQDELSERRPGYKALCCGLLLELIVSLSWFYEESDVSDHEEIWGIGRTLKMLETHYAKKHSIDALAKEAGMSRRNFQRIFSKAVGESPVKYLLRTRIEKAAEMLLESPAMPIGELALKTGFSDSNYFARQFMHHFNVSPMGYRSMASKITSPNSVTPFGTRLG